MRLGLSWFQWLKVFLAATAMPSMRRAGVEFGSNDISNRVAAL
jgi:hypothetical protein